MTVLRKASLLCGLAFAFVLFGSSASWASPSADLAAVHAADDAWVKAYNAGQLENVVALYDESAVVYPPGAMPLHGRAAIRESFEKDMAGFAKAGLTFSLDANPEGDRKSTRL